MTRNLVLFLRRIPTNATKCFPGKTLRESAELNEVCECPNMIAPKTQVDAFITIKGILGYAVEIG